MTYAGYANVRITGAQKKYLESLVDAGVSSSVSDGIRLCINIMMSEYAKGRLDPANAGKRRFGRIRL